MCHFDANVIFADVIWNGQEHRIPHCHIFCIFCKYRIQNVGIGKSIGINQLTVGIFQVTLLIKGQRKSRKGIAIAAVLQNANTGATSCNFFIGGNMRMRRKDSINFRVARVSCHSGIQRIIITVNGNDYNVALFHRSELFCKIFYNISRVNKVVILNVDGQNRGFNVANDANDADFDFAKLNNRVRIHPLNSFSGAVIIDICTEERELRLTVGEVAILIFLNFVKSPVKLVVADYKSVKIQFVQSIQHRQASQSAAHIGALKHISICNLNDIAKGCIIAYAGCDFIHTAFLFIQNTVVVVDHKNVDGSKGIGFIVLGGRGRSGAGFFRARGGLDAGLVGLGGACFSLVGLRRSTCIRCVGRRGTVGFERRHG